jgi:pimeloyl-ACP methyl ester carboxylesterase
VLHSQALALATSKPYLVLLHGWGYNSTCWPASMLQRLRTRYELILLDLPGHGHDTFVEDGRNHLVQLDEWIIATKKSLPCQYHVLGWSLGAQLAIRMAHNDTRIQSVILMAVNPKFITSNNWPSAMMPELLAQFHHDYETLPNKTLRRFANLQAQGSILPKILVTQVIKLMQVKEENAFGLHLLQQLDEREHLCKLTQLCYIELAKGDSLIPYGWVEQLKLPNNVQVSYVKGSHGYLLEQYAVTHKMANFLNLEVGL